MPNNSVQSIIKSADQIPFSVLIISVQDNPGSIVYANAAFLRLAECASLEELRAFTGNDYRALVSRESWYELPDEPPAGASGGPADLGHRYYQIVSKTGTRRNVVDSGMYMDDERYGKVYALYISIYDASADVLIFDPISGLHNRTYLMRRYHDLMGLQADGECCHGRCSVCYLQIVRFRDFNEAYGQDAGNALLHDLGGLMTSVFQTESCARLYADQFAVFYCGDDVEDRCRELHERALNLREGYTVRVEAGIYTVGSEEVTAAVALDRAKVACDAVGGDGHRFVNVYSEELSEELRLDVYIVEHIDSAIENGHLEVWYQPVIRTMTEEVSSFEALARWNDPEYGMISPSRFIPVLEEKRLVYKVDRFVVEHACSSIAAWVGLGHEAVPISINISRVDFTSNDPVSIITSCVESFGLDADLISIEITETAAMRDPIAVAEAVRRFRAAGHEVLMDDFGSAYSSLNALRMFEFNEIKLDMAFMEDFDVKTREVVTAIVTMAKELGMHTLAEGVETKAQAMFLRSIGCEHLQGFYYGRPQPARRLARWMELSHIQLEHRSDRFLHDQAGLVQLTPSRLQALLYDDGERFDPLYANDAFIRKLQDDDPDLLPVEYVRLANDDSTGFGAKLRAAADCAASSKSPESFHASVAAGRFRFEVRTLADHAGRRIQLVDCTDIMGERQYQDRKEALLLGVSDGFDGVYLIDPQAAKATVLFSSLEGERPGETVPTSSLRGLDEVHPDDRLRFVDMLEPSRLEQAARSARRGRYSIPIRCKTSAGGYEWWEFSFVGVGTPSTPKYLMCARACPMDLADLRILAASSLEDEHSREAADAAAKPVAASRRESPFPYVEVQILRDGQGSPIDFVYLYANAAYAKRVHVGAADLAGRRYLEVFPQGSYQWPLNMDSTVSLGSQMHYLIYGQALDSWTECYMAPLEGKDRVAVILVTPDNTTGLVGQELFNSYNDVPLPCIVMRPVTANGAHDMEYVYANDRYCRLVGKSPSELLGHGYLELFEWGSHEWVEFGQRAAAGELIHEKVWGPVQKHWMDVYAVPSSVAGCCVMVSVPIDEQRKRLSKLTSGRATDTAVIEIARQLVGPTSYQSAMNSALFTLGRALAVSGIFVLECLDDEVKRAFTYLDPGCDETLSKGCPLESAGLPAWWRIALEEGKFVVSSNVPLGSGAFFEQVEIPNRIAWGGVDTLMIAPFVERGTLEGVLVAVNARFEQTIDAVALFETASFFIRSSFVGNLARFKATYDALTSVRSREAFESAVRDIDEATAGVGIVFADIDNLKEMNDDHGHSAGDALLMNAAQALCDVFSESNVYRMGGDEFVVLLKNVAREDFEHYRLALAERLSEEQGMSISTGFAWEPDASDIHSMIERADQEMYLNKERHHETMRPSAHLGGGVFHSALRSDEARRLAHTTRQAAPQLHGPDVRAGS